MAHKNLTKQDVVGWLVFMNHKNIAEMLANTDVKTIKMYSEVVANREINKLRSEKSS